MKCTKHEQHDCVYCWRDKLESELDALRAQKPCLFAYKIFSSSSGFVYTEDESEAARGGADSGGYKKLYAQPLPAPAQVPDEWRSVMQDSAAIFRHYEALHKAKGGIADDKAERNRLAAERIEALLQPQPAEPVIDKPTLPPGWQVVRVPDVEFQPRDQIYISKIGVDGKAERGGTACRLDDSSLFWHFFNDWLLMQEGAG